MGNQPTYQNWILLLRASWNKTALSWPANGLKSTVDTRYARIKRKEKKMKEKEKQQERRNEIRNPGNIVQVGIISDSGERLARHAAKAISFSQDYQK